MMKSIVKLSLMTLIMLLSIGNISAQNVFGVSGVIYDADSNPMPGAYVVIKGTKTGTFSDKNGKFSLSRVTKGSTLQFSFTGFKTLELQVNNDKTLKVTMEEDANLLEDAVITVAYGTVNKKDLTGSVSSVHVAEMNKMVVSSVDQAIQGRIAGVQMSSGDGQPGSSMDIVIRGANSLTQSTAPLYVVDGFPIENFNLGSISSNDIESISVLKDASATSMYGSRGANGVIIITTKQGKKGKTRVRYSGSFTMQSVTKTQDVMDPYEYVLYQIERDPNNFNRYLTGANRTLQDYRDMKGIDWQDMIFRNAPMHKHELSVSGGSDKTIYNVSASYVDQKGVLINSGYQNFYGKVALTQEVFKNFKMRLNASYQKEYTYGQVAAEKKSTSNSFATYLMYRTWGSRPFYISDDAGVDDLFDEDSGTYSIMNPKISSENEYNVKPRQRIIVNLQLEYKFAKDFTLKVMGGYDDNFSEEEKFNNSKTYGGYTSSYNTKGVNGSYSTWRRRTFVNENTLTFWKRFNDKHRMDATIGCSLQDSKVRSFGFSNEHIPLEDLGMSGLELGLPYTSKASISTSGLLSYFAKVNYDFKKRYFFTAAFRADGSSKFAKGNKWGYFPSVAFAWKIKKEPFMRNVRFISDAKLRLSYGLTGNNRVGDFEYYSQMWVSDFYSVGDQVPDHTIVPGKIGNNRLTWETTRQFDIGLDLSMFKDRLNFVLDFYRKDTNDLLMKANLPTASGYSNMYRNVGKIRNDGVELSITSHNIKKRNFDWTTQFNISFNRGTLRELTDGQESLLSKVDLTATYNSTYLYLAKKGGPLASFYGYQWDGVYHYDDFNVVNGKYILKDNITSNGTNRATIKPGDIKYVDQNGDLNVDDRDLVVIGRGAPIHTGGINNNFRYKNWSLSFFFQWSYGNHIMNANRLYFETGDQSINKFATYADRWRPENSDSNIPSVTGKGPAGVYSSYTIEDGSYLRLKNVQLAYSFPYRWIRRIRFEDLQIYVSGINLWTLTNYSGLDPEVSVRNSVLTPGFDYSAYPRNRTITIGINCTF